MSGEEPDEEPDEEDRVWMENLPSFPLLDLHVHT